MRTIIIGLPPTTLTFLMVILILTCSQRTFSSTSSQSPTLAIIGSTIKIDYTSTGVTALYNAFITSRPVPPFKY